MSGVLEALWGQQSDPLAFLEALHRYPGRLWWPAWRLRLGLAAGGMAVLGLLAAWSGRSGREMAGYGLLLPALFPMFVAIPIMVTHHFQFWLLYVYSPPVLIVGLSCGLVPLWPVWGGLVGAIGFPFLLGVMVSDACTLWVGRKLKEARRERRRRRAGGPPADLPALSLWRRARLTRLLASAALGLTLWFVWGTVIAGLAGLAGGLRLEATAFAWLSGGAPVRFDPGRGRWQATYAGRLALFAPSRGMQALFEPSSPQEQSAALLALLRQGYLGPAASKGVRGLSLEAGYRLVLHLSLRSGGGGAIDHLRPDLARPLQPVAETLAALAAEAAKPFDLQGWIGVLSRRLPAATTALPEVGGELCRSLEQVRKGLLALSPGSPAVDAAIDQMGGLVRSLDEASPAGGLRALAWPEALLLHVTRHRERLHAF